MAPAGRQLRKRKDVHYRIPPPPRLPSDRRKKSGIRTKRRAISGSTAKKSAQQFASSENQSAAGVPAASINNSNTSANSHEPEDDFTFPAPAVPFDRARSPTVMGDDMVVQTPSRKRRKTCDPSQLPTPSTSSELQRKERARSTISPATEAAIQQMPQEIEKAITSLNSIKNIVEGLLEFKVILDLEAARVLPNVARHQATG